MLGESQRVNAVNIGRRQDGSTYSSDDLDASRVTRSYGTHHSSIPLHRLESLPMNRSQSNPHPTRSVSVPTYTQRSGALLPSIRKPSVELLGSVKLRPTYFSFPPPRMGRSPTVPTLKVPRYGYYYFSDGDDEVNKSSSNGSDTPGSLLRLFEMDKGSESNEDQKVAEEVGAKPSSNRKLTVFEATLNSLNYFFGVRRKTHCDSLSCLLLTFIALMVLNK